MPEEVACENTSVISKFLIHRLLLLQHAAQMNPSTASALIQSVINQTKYANDASTVAFAMKDT
jgi:hypothetical protein